MSLRTEPVPTDESAPPLPPDVAWLREARERSGVTLAQLSKATKIRPVYLDALEAGAVDRLPPTFFTRGFVKAYATVIGLDPDRTADRYIDQIGFIGPADGDDVAAIVETAVGRTGVIGFEKHHAPLIQSLTPDQSSRLLVAAAVVGAVIYLGPSHWGWAPKVVAASSAGASALPAPTPAPPVETASAPVTPLADAALQFEIEPQGECWFSAAADGSDRQSALLNAGDRRRIEVRDALVLRVGDPASCAFSINGHAGRPLGAAGVPVTVRITKDNFKGFIGS